MTQPLEIDTLLARCLRGDQASFAALYDQYAPLIYRLCYSLLMNHQDAEDVTQEAFVYAFRNLRRYDPSRSAFKTWLYTIALSRCRNAYRRWQLPQLNVLQLLTTEVAAPRSETPESSLAQADVKAALEQALAALTPRLREAVILRYGLGLTYREMAEVVGCPQKTAESRVRLAHERLRELLQPAGQSLLDEWVSI